MHIDSQRGTPMDGNYSPFPTLCLRALAMSRARSTVGGGCGVWTTVGPGAARA